MDGVLTAALGVAPQLGGLVVFVVIIGILIRREVQTTERHGAEITRLITTHDGETAETRTELERLRRERDAAEQLLRQHWHEFHGPGADPPGG